MADKKETISPTDKPVFFWQTTEFESHKKPKGWLFYVILAGLLLTAGFLWFKYWLAAGVVVAATLALISQSRTSGKKKSYAIYDQGITIDDRVYGFDQLKSFWIFDSQGRAIVRFEQLSRLALPIEMPIDLENPEQVRLFLSKHLPEAEDRGEDVADKINRWIKF